VREWIKPAATYSPNAGLGVSTIGPKELNCRVRNGNGCFLFGITTGNISVFIQKLVSKPKHLSGNRHQYLYARGIKSDAKTCPREKGEPEKKDFPLFVIARKKISLRWHAISIDCHARNCPLATTLRVGSKNMAKPHGLLVPVS
jgi:hypothetical protein